jgi:hypothetical protein
LRAALALSAVGTCVTVLTAYPAAASTSDLAPVTTAAATSVSTPAGSPSAPSSEASGEASIEAVAEAAAGAQDQADAQTDDAVARFFRNVEFTGLVDAYYTYNFNEPPTGTFTPLRNFDVRHNQFSVALVELALSKPPTPDDRVGFRFDLDYGQVAQIFNADPLDGNSLLNVQQAYVSYMMPVGSGLTLDFGKFVTPIGTEPTESKDNFNYSRAFLYALGPYYHVGARLGYAINEKVSLGGIIVNGWNASGDNNSGKSVGAGITIRPTPRVTIVQNVLVGPEQNDNSDDIRKLFDTNLAVTLTDTMAAGLNYAHNRDSIAGEDVHWQGLALYFRSQITPVFAVAPRFEIFNDDAGLVSGAVQDLREFTLTGELKSSGGLLFRAEYRRDWSNIDFFEKDGDFVDNQNTVTFSFVYSFSSKAP